jgi:hypothetical protein
MYISTEGSALGTQKSRSIYPERVAYRRRVCEEPMNTGAASARKSVFSVNHPVCLSEYGIEYDQRYIWD